MRSTSQPPVFCRQAIQEMDVYSIDTSNVQRQVESLHLQMKDIEVHSFKGLDK